MFEKIKKIKEKAEMKVIEFKINRDQKGGPAIEEVGLMIFIAVPVLAKAGLLGSTMESVFDKSIDAIKKGLGII